MIEESIWKKIKKVLSNRLVLLTVLIGVMFYSVILKFFDLQIVNGEMYNNILTSTRMQNITLNAPRGTINDRFGRPLAENKSAYIVKIDPSVEIYNNSEILRANEVLHNLIKLFEANGEKYVEDFPISKDMPYRFMFSGSETRELRWKEDMDISKDLTASEAFVELRNKFKIPDEMPDSEAWKLLNLRCMVYMYRYRPYNAITVAFDVKNDTVTEIEERNERFPSVYLDAEPMRSYPHHKYVSHILGYIGSITDAELTSLKERNPEYTAEDKIGKSGLERSMETQLKGKNGKMTVEVITNLGRPIRWLDTKEPTQGNKIFLTLDIDLQRKTYEILESTIKEIIINKLLSTNSREAPITITEIFASLVRNNCISLNRVLLASEGEFSYDLRRYIYERIPGAGITGSTSDEKVEEIKEVLAEGIEEGNVSPKTVLLSMYEQGVITADEDYLQKMVSGTHTTLKVLLDKIEQDEITPQMMNLDPCSGSVVVLDLKDNGVLASVNYPSYDNNQLVNNFNSSYYQKLNQDATHPMINRAFMEPRAPGSTFKMISAIAGLQYGVITPRTLIYDGVVFEKAGKPFTSNWSTSSFGNIDVAKALEISCNYFFCDIIYMMGNQKLGNQLASINELNKYMASFGLNSPTGVEIGEWYYSAIDSSYPDAENISVTSSPGYKEYVFKSRDPDATKWDYDWYDGDTVKTAIGQGYNNYTTATMAKYIATLATGGERYAMHFLNKIETQQGKLVEEYVPKLEEKLEISPENLSAVYDGMLRVLEGVNGTGRNVFKDFPVRVAGKTGTAQEQKVGRNDHTSFGGFAPYEDPKIAIYVMIPFGDTVTTSAPSARVARDVIAYYSGIDAEPQRGPKENSLLQ